MLSSTRPIQCSGLIRWGSDAIVQQKNFVGSFQRLKGHRRPLIERACCQTDVSGTTIKKR